MLKQNYQHKHIYMEILTTIICHQHTRMRSEVVCQSAQEKVVGRKFN